MKELFAKVYLDEDVNVLVAEILRSMGYEVTTASEMRRKGKSDSDQLLYASEMGSAILTHNRTDFQDLALDYFDKGLTHFGIIISVLRPARQIVVEMDDVLNRLAADELRDQVIYI